MSASVVTELRDWVAKLRQEIPAEFHHLVDEGHSILAKLTGEAEADAGQLAQHAAADAEAAVAGDAKGASGPGTPSA